MNRVTLIQCTNTKRDEECLAEHLYDESAYYRKMRLWARARGNPWFILSAKHGLLNPNRVTSPYDAVGLTEQQAEDIATELAGMDVDTVDVTAGRKYTDNLVPALKRQGIDVINHFAGLRIGERQKRLEAKTLELLNR